MRHSRSVWGFFVSALAWFIGITLLWMQVSTWTSYPAALLARVALTHGAPDWIRSVSVTPQRLEAETRIEVYVPGQPRSKGRAELVPDVEPAHYAYGLPLFLALLAAARSRRFAAKAITGYLILLAPQAVSLVFDILRQIITAGGNPVDLRIAQWQMEGIVFGYQCGTLVLPTLVPVALWLWFERGFIAAIMVDGWLRKSAAMPDPEPSRSTRRPD